MAPRRKLTPKEFERRSREILLRMQGLAKPFADDSEAAKKRRREQGEKDHFWFMRTYLPHYFFKPFSAFQRRKVEMLETRGKALMARAEPREHGKSAIASFGYEIHQACYQKRHYMIILSDTQDLAAEFVQWIKLEFEENPRLRQDFGDLVTAGYWTDDDIVVGGKVRIRAVGRGQRIRGTRFMQWRPDLIDVDDLENDINVKNKKLVKETLQWLLSACYGSLDRNGTMMMHGTMLARVSVLSLLVRHIREKAEEFVQKYGVRRMDAEVLGAITPEGEPLWPENYTLEELEQIRMTVGSVVWAADYMNQPIDQGVIKEEWIRYVLPEEIAIHPQAYFSGSDPSARHGENNDYKAVIVLARDQENKTLTVAHAFIRRCSIGEMDQAFINRYREFKMLGCGFETNGFQMVVKEDLEKRCQAEGLYPPIVSVEHRTDKLLRMGRLGPMIERGVLRFIKGHSDQDLLVEQLCALGGNEKDDGPDALEMAVAMAERGAAEFAYRESDQKRIRFRARQEGYFA